MPNRSTALPITILLAEDHSLVREGIRKLLETENDFEVVGEATNGRRAVEMARTLQPVVVLMDIAMPQLNGIEATRQILREFPKTKILILSAHSDDLYIEHLNEVNASGYVIKQSTSVTLAKAIREVAKGNRFFSPTVSKRLRGREDNHRNAAKTDVTLQLSSREMEVLQLISEGKANKQIAGELRISIKTVEKHRQNLMDKLAIHDTASLTRYAISMGIIENRVQRTTA